MTPAHPSLLLQRGEVAAVDVHRLGDVASPVALASGSSRPPLSTVTTKTPRSLFVAVSRRPTTFTIPLPTSLSFPRWTDVTTAPVGCYPVPGRKTVHASSATRGSMGAACH